MVSSDMQAELEKLRAEVATLKKQRENKVSSVQQRSPGGQSAEKTEGKSAQTNSQEVDAEQSTAVSSHLQDLVDVFEQELKENKPMTLLIVLVFGVLIGRLWPR